MKLLFDNNLSYRLTFRLADLVDECQHVRNIGLDDADDLFVWEYARDNDYIIVTKDEDFSFLSRLNGFPPKVIWLKIGNCTTKDIEQLLVTNLDDIRATLSEDVGIVSVEQLPSK